MDIFDYKNVIDILIGMSDEQKKVLAQKLVERFPSTTYDLASEFMIHLQDREAEEGIVRHWDNVRKQIMMDTFNSIISFLYVEATAQPLIFLLFILVGLWLLFQKTYVTILSLFTLWLAFLIGGYYG